MTKRHLILNFYWEIFFRFIESASAQKRYVLLAKKTGISEKRLRNANQTFRASTVDRALSNAKKFLDDQLEKRGFDANERLDWIANQPKSPLASLVYTCEIPIDVQYPRARAFASKIDNLFEKLTKTSIEGDLTRAIAILADEPWLDDWYLAKNIKSRSTTEKSKILDAIQDDGGWDALEKLIVTIAANSLFSWLAMWDVEFYSTQLGRLAPSSVFARLLPTADIPETGPIEKKRGMFQFPVSRLIDLSYAMAYYGQHQTWPDRRPTVKELSLRSNEPEQNLVNWRDGTKRHTWNHFEQIWKAFFTSPDGMSSNVRPLIPLYVVATIFQDFLVCINSNSREKTIHLFDDEYLDWWNFHSQDVALAKRTSLEDISWPEWLKQASG